MLHVEPEAAELLSKRGHQLLIELERENTIESLEQWLGERTMSRSDFNDSGRFGSEYICNPLGNRSINQEVLAEPTTLWPTHERSYEF